MMSEKTPARQAFEAWRTNKGNVPANYFAQCPATGRYLDERAHEAWQAWEAVYQPLFRVRVLMMRESHRDT